jgi:hypothetical protein cdiviTM7_02749
MVVTHQQLEELLLSFPDAWLDYPFGEKVAVYKVGRKDAGQNEKMFALIAEDSKPLRVSLKCDPQLSLNLQRKYESVQSGFHLNKKHWITVICSGQLSDDELFDLARLSHRLVTE